MNNYVIVYSHEKGSGIEYRDTYHDAESYLKALRAIGYKADMYQNVGKEVGKTFNLVGNPIDGFSLYGPFECDADAVDWQEDWDYADCWLIDANKP